MAHSKLCLEILTRWFPVHILPGSLPARFLSLKPESRTILLQPMFLLPSTIFWLYLEDLLFFESFGCHALWHLLKLGSIPWLAVIIRIVRFSTFRSSDENHNCSCFQPNISLHMMFAKSTEVDHSLFIFWKEKTHLWPSFPPKRSYRARDGAICQQGLSEVFHQALLRKAAQMQLPHYSDL